MTTLIEFGCSVSQEKAAQTIIEAFCKKTGDLLLGRHVNEETHEVLLIVQLLHMVSVRRHAKALSHTLQHGAIVSSRSVTCELVKVSLDPSADLTDRMRNFPLRPGEHWFSAINDPHQAYVCMSRPLMLPVQAAWLVGHEVVWEFV
jgi:hypothetical protein